jgi:hypothetical protein
MIVSLIKCQPNISKNIGSEKVDLQILKVHLHNKISFKFSSNFKLWTQFKHKSDSLNMFSNMFDRSIKYWKEIW